uniref:Uncharacterized protein n=1 Tax=Glossina palpalis gambiensis TaxID=67801 RepID=A0A1B0AV46_9MUSC
MFTSSRELFKKKVLFTKVLKRFNGVLVVNTSHLLVKTLTRLPRRLLMEARFTKPSLLPALSLSVYLIAGGACALPIMLLTGTDKRLLRH